MKSPIASAHFSLSVAMPVEPDEIPIPVLEPDAGEAKDIVCPPVRPGHPQRCE